MKTRAELVVQIAENLGVAIPGETLSSEDSTTIDAVIDPAIALLETNDIAYFGATDEFEDAYFLPLADYIADKVKTPYGKASDVAIGMMAAKAEQDLRMLSRPQATRKTLTVDRALLTTSHPGWYRG
jgi:hypothetical protein